ncbi:MAG TPA: VWA domain-containing protein [Bryobacteraceae bacterium]|nr:VWA domain-containing protein [Bryobacteraceae bacterium]
MFQRLQGMRFLRTVWLAATLAGFASAQPDVVIRSTTRLVQVHVAAADRQGNPVADLRKEEFQILDDGKPQPLALFVGEGGSTGREVEPTNAAAVPEHAKAQAPGYSAILLDWLNASIADRLRAVDGLRAVLKSLQPRQKVALYALGLEPPNSAAPLRLIRNFTDAPVELANVIEDPGVLPNPELSEPPGRFDARFGNPRGRMNVEEQLYDWNNRIRDTARALSELAGRMAPLRGPKSLIWLSTGFPMVVNGGVVPGAHALDAVYYREVEGAVDRLNRADVTVHTVNSSGLAPVTRTYEATLQHFAERTGGLEFFGRNDLPAGVRAALEDMHAGYTLGFVVPEGGRPGVHNIQVRSTRPRLALRFRDSYELAW